MSRLRNLPIINRLQEEWAIIAIVGGQGLLAAVLNLSSPDLPLHDDSITFFTQGLMLWLGSFPPDPNRPILYPFFLSLGMKLFGLDVVRLRSLQIVLLLLTTVLLYRLTRILLGRRPALLAAILYVLFPSGIFQANELYRESITPFFVILTLNLCQYMLAEPARRVRAFYAGAAAGLLVMIKPEFGTLMAFLAGGDFFSALRVGEWRKRVGTWLVCGASALLAISPAVLADRAAFNEWIFVCVNTGKYFAVSYCGRLERETPEDRHRDFFALDADRFARVNPQVNRVFYASPPAVPFQARDRKLLAQAGQCIAEDPGQALTMIIHRGLGALFLYILDPIWMIVGGRFGPNWPAPAVQGLELLSLLVTTFTILFLLPGLLRLWKTRPGRIVVLAVAWAVLFYSLSFFRTRLIFAVYTPFIIAGVGGWEEMIWKWKASSRSGRGLFLIWVVVCLAGFAAVSRPWQYSAFHPAAWKTITIEAGSSDDDKRRSLLTMAQIMAEQNQHARLDTDLRPFIAIRRAGYSSALLGATGNRFLAKDQFTVAAFFYRTALDLYGPDPAVSARLDRIAARKTSARLGAWTPVRDDRSSLPSIYTAALSPPAAVDPNFPDPQIKLRGPRREFKYNPRLLTEREPQANQFFLRASQLFITLPRGEPPPSETSPLTLDYFASPPESLAPRGP